MINSMGRAGRVARWENRHACRILVGKLEGKRPLERPRRRWVDNIKMDLGETGWGAMDWVGLAQNMNTVMNLWFP
jgi:hypothetical protein